MKHYYVFMCPKCRNFTNAPVGQKHRKCSYCGTTIDIGKANVALFDDQHAAILAVQRFNAGRDDEFDKAVQRSRDRIRALMPTQPLSIEDSEEEPIESTSTSGKMRRLMELLETMASDSPCNLDDFKAAAERASLEWEWVDQAITKMASEGAVVFPKPWLIRWLTHDSKNSSRSQQRVDLTQEILRMLRKNGGSMTVESIIRHYEDNGVARESIENSLERLMQTGRVFEPRSGIIQLL
ncbi:MAG: hypothetical protein QXS20_04500 [Candidatus Thorarchaeota archaeon]